MMSRLPSAISRQEPRNGRLYGVDGEDVVAES